jgi:hypothetical protein
VRRGPGVLIDEEFFLAGHLHRTILLQERWGWPDYSDVFTARAAENLVTFDDHLWMRLQPIPQNAQFGHFFTKIFLTHRSLF